MQSPASALDPPAVDGLASGSPPALVHGFGSVAHDTRSGALPVSLVARTEHRRPAEVLPTRTTTALQVAAAGYTAAHGDPTTRAAVSRRRVRWAISWRLSLATGAVLLLVAGAIALRASALAPGPAVVLPTPVPSGPVASEAPTVVAEVVVDVVGAVAAPGVVRLAQGSRVVDAIAAAGGATAEAQVSSLNLARVLVDGEQIAVPRPGDLPAQAAAAEPAGGDGLVDLNTADAASLDSLPGIGPVLADRIVAHREDRPFTTVDELADVAGIGPTLLERLRDLVRV
ncbi:ComEA family DNA-binding protein [Cellulomonas sp. P5_C5]